MADYILDTDQERPTFEENSRGQRGSRSFIVFTGDLAAAMSLPGIPRVGEAWDVAYPDCVLESRVGQYEWGRDEVSGRRGCVRIRCSYATPGFGGRANDSALQPADGVKFAEHSVETGSETIIYGRSPGSASGPANTVVNNGKGSPVEVTGHTVRVVKYYSSANFAAVNLASLQPYEQTLNATAVNVPPTLGIGPPQEFLPKTLRYRGTTASLESRLVKVTHEFVYAEDHRVYWDVEGADGKPIGAVGVADVYDESSWPVSVFF
jgi:hypothetical protein